MEFLYVIILIIIIVSSAMPNKKKNEQKRKRALNNQTKPSVSQNESVRTNPVEVKQNAKNSRLNPTEPLKSIRFEDAGEGEDPCHEKELRPGFKGMRFKAASDELMKNAGEGEDPCHVGETMLANSSEEKTPVSDGSAFRKEVLKGIIMAEVLTSPAERRKLRRAGRVRRI